MKPLVIYHASCADGFGAAFAAWMKLGDKAEYAPMQYGEKLVGVDIADMNDRDVYILDFSFPREVIDGVFAAAKRVFWLDHHKTAFEMWCGSYTRGMRFSDHNDPYIELNDNKSGALLAWEYFHPNAEAPMLIRHIDDYDRWQFKLDGTKEFIKALWSYAPWSFEHWQILNISIQQAPSSKPEFGDAYIALLREGAAILRAHEQNVKSVVNHGARRCSIVPHIIDSAESYKAPWVWWTDPEHGDTCGASGLAANCPPHLSSDVGHKLATQSGTFGLLWYLDKDNRCKCSLRSNGDYDVSAIAKAFGGGGHKNAAGFEVPIETLLGWLN